MTPRGSQPVGRLVLQYVDERARLGQLTGTSPTTIRHRLWMFAEFMGPSTPVAKITRRRIEKWLLSMGTVSKTTLRMRHSSVKTFCTWLVEHGYLSRNPAAFIPAPRQPRNLPPRALAAEQVHAVYRQCPDPRAELIVTLMVQEGLRAGEVATLEVGDVDLTRRTLRVTGKGGHQRALALSDESASVARRYIDDNRLTAGPLVRSLLDPYRGILPETVSKAVGRVMRDASVRESGHALRHTAASDMLEHGCHVRTLQTILGHRSLSTTERYLRATVGDIRDAMGGRSYRTVR